MRIYCVKAPKFLASILKVICKRFIIKLCKIRFIHKKTHQIGEIKHNFHYAFFAVLIHFVQAFTVFSCPSITIVVFCKLTSYVLFDFLLLWLTLWPAILPLPHTSHTLLIVSSVKISYYTAHIVTSFSKQIKKFLLFFWKIIKNNLKNCFFYCILNTVC